MSILIKGMAMPERCIDCELCTLKVMGAHRTTCIICRHNGEEIALHGRREDCPLIELPPHGDLVDRDALMKDGWLSLWKRVDYMGGYAVHDLPLINPSIPVVIESEGKA